VSAKIGLEVFDRLGEGVGSLEIVTLVVTFFSKSECEFEGIRELTVGEKSVKIGLELIDRLGEGVGVLRTVTLVNVLISDSEGKFEGIIVEPTVGKLFGAAEGSLAVGCCTGSYEGTIVGLGEGPSVRSMLASYLAKGEYQIKKQYEGMR
jgi:hypothetical protein